MPPNSKKKKKSHLKQSSHKSTQSTSYPAIPTALSKDKTPLLSIPMDSSYLMSSSAKEKQKSAIAILSLN